jgi:iron complex outermembrane receptor protein
MTLKAGLLASAAAMFLGVGVSPVRSQTAEQPSPPRPAATALPEVVVTAQKRQERAQDVPESIAVVAAPQLKAMSAVNYGDYLNSVPGVSYVDSGGFKDKIFIRGLADTMSSRVLSTTGIYLDETPVTEVDASLADFGTFDMNRIEILRGPQGTLYGSESMGGTVRIITNKPNLSQYQGDIDLIGSGTEHGGGNYNLNGMVNLPLIEDKLALRIVAGGRHDSGYVENVANDDHDANTDDATSVRALLDARPTPNLDALFTFAFQRSTDDYGPYQDIGLGLYQVDRVIPEINKSITRLYNLTFNYTLPFAVLTSATSYIDKSNYSVRDVTPYYQSLFLSSYEADTGQNAPGNTGVGLTYAFPNRALTQEFRLTSSGGGPLHWIVGLYYNDFLPTQVQTAVTNYEPAKGYDLYTTSTQFDRTELAEFADISFDVTEKLQIAAGVRQADYFINSNNTSSGVLNGGDTAEDDKSHESATSARFRADYKVTKDNLVYAQASQGFRPGGVNGLLPSTCLASAQALGYANAGAVYKYNPDSVWNYEVGSKNDFDGHKYQLNGDVYYIDWKNTEVAQNLACGDQILSNAGGATSRGVELEAQAHPLAGLDFSFGAAYTEATFNSTSASVETLKGATLPNVPKWTINGSARYTYPTPYGFDVYVFANAYYVDRRMSDLPLSGTDFGEPGYILANARIGLTQGAFDVAFFVKNVANTIAIINTNTDTGYDYQIINQPRTWGLEIERKF